MIVLTAIIASGIGSTARAWVAETLHRRTAATYPWGTLAVNLTGAFALGALAGLHAGGNLAPDVLTVAGAGFCGGFTTFSTWMVESVWLAREGPARPIAAAVNLLAMLVVGVAAAAAGTALG